MAKISIKHVLLTCTWKYFWWISRKYLNFAGPRQCEISEALFSKITLMIIQENEINEQFLTLKHQKIWLLF